MSKAGFIKTASRLLGVASDRAPASSAAALSSYVPVLIRPGSSIKAPSGFRVSSRESSNLVSNHHDAFAFLPECDDAEINWTVANPLELPSPALRNLEKDLARDFNKYRALRGSETLISSARDYFVSRGIPCERGNVIIGTGIFNILGKIYKILKLKEDKKKVLIPTPVFGALNKQCVDEGISTVLLETKKEDNWQINPEALDRILSENTDIKVLLTNFPNNPTGAIMTEENARAVSEVLERHGVINISDAILEDLILKAGSRSHSIASTPESRDSSIVITSAAKAYGLAGLNVAIAKVPEGIANDYRVKVSHDLDMPPYFAQRVVAAALVDNEENREYLEKSIIQYRQNISHIQQQIEFLNQKLAKHFDEEGQIYVKPYIADPEAGNTYLLDFSGLKDKLMGGGNKMTTGLDVAKFLLTKAGIGVVPGECSFLRASDMLVRIPTSTPQEEVALGFEKVGQAIIKNLKNPSRFHYSSPSEEDVGSRLR